MFFLTAFYCGDAGMNLKFLRSKSGVVCFVSILFMLYLATMLSAACSGISERELYKVQTNIPPKGTVEYNIAIDKSSYIYNIAATEEKD